MAKKHNSLSKENFINIIYEIILETQAQKTSDFRVETAKKIGIILNGYININPEDKRNWTYGKANIRKCI